MKTLTFFAVLLDQSCSFQIEFDTSNIGVDVMEAFGCYYESDSGEDSDAEEGVVFSRHVWHPSHVANCKEHIILCGIALGDHMYSESSVLSYN